MQFKTALLVAACGFVALTGCQSEQPPAAAAPMGMSQRGSQLLAAGSPKSAITFLSQSAASASDPDSLALLSLACALDGQAAKALQYASQVKREATAAPGWEAVAVGIAQLTQQKHFEAVATFQRIVAAPPSRITPAARQWLILAYVLRGDYGSGIASLRAVPEADPSSTTSLIWLTLLYARQGHAYQASSCLIQAAFLLAKDPGTLGMNPDDQSLYDAALVAVAAGKLDVAQELLAELLRNNPSAGDATTWMALITAARGDWATGRALLKQACEEGSVNSRGLASQVYTVVCATEDRPEDMVRYMVTGQRLLARANSTRNLTPQGGGDAAQPAGSYAPRTITAGIPDSRPAPPTRAVAPAPAPAPVPAPARIHAGHAPSAPPSAYPAPAHTSPAPPAYAPPAPPVSPAPPAPTAHAAPAAPAPAAAPAHLPPPPPAPRVADAPAAPPAPAYHSGGEFRGTTSLAFPSAVRP